MSYGIESALSNYSSFDYGSYIAKNHAVASQVSVRMLGNVMEQAGVEAEGLIDMMKTAVPPPAAINEIGGILDVRA
ncbi:MAG: putative motility protein [Oscillospiraceae bacterium]|nr:putative motility protein [Oscillospiraceae bacterium]